MKNLFASLRFLLFFTLLTGFLYPLVITVAAKLVFPKQAAGSLVVRNGKVLGSELIAQGFQDPRYFWPRPSAVDFNPLPSGGSNLGPASHDLFEKLEARRKQGLTNELVFASGSGLDPHISPAAALSQLERVGGARKLSGVRIAELRGLVDKSIEWRQFGVFGEARVNVLKLNLALDERFRP